MKVAIVVFLLIMGCFGRRAKVISGLEGQTLPTFNLLLTDSSTRINTNNIPKGKPFVLFYFSPFCPYCRAQTEELREEINSVRELQFYFVSAFPLYQVRIFEDHYGLSKYKNITVAQIKDTMFSKYFKISGVPYIAVYNRDKHLKEVLLGKVNASDIVKAAFEN